MTTEDQQQAQAPSAPDSQAQKDDKRGWRPNLITLLLAAYSTLIIVYALLILADGMAPQDALELLNNPLIALIGGTVAISKDLI